jgi:hypothetical protein
VKGEKPVYPNWLNHFHPARKDKDTCGVVLEIDFARWWTFTAYRFNLPLYSSSKGDCSPFDPVPGVAREAPPKISRQIYSLTLIVQASRTLYGVNSLNSIGGLDKSSRQL